MTSGEFVLPAVKSAAALSQTASIKRLEISGSGMLVTIMAKTWYLLLLSKRQASSGVWLPTAAGRYSSGVSCANASELTSES